MNETILDNLKVIKPEDTLYFLGDFLFGPDKPENFKKFWARINTTKIVYCEGNHCYDWFRKKNNIKEVEKIVGKVHQVWEGEIDGHNFWLSHYRPEEYYSRENPHKISRTRERREENFGNSSYVRKPNVLHLWGHEHAGKPDNPNQLGLEIGIDTEWYGHKRYTPYHLDEILYIMKTYKKL